MGWNQPAHFVGALIGAAVGLAIGHLYTTGQGALRRKQLIRFIDDLMVDAVEAQRMWLRLKDTWATFDRDRRAVGRAWPPEGAA